jgi:formylglycine-generating enzyme required for sulfatase activity
VRPRPLTARRAALAIATGGGGLALVAAFALACSTSTTPSGGLLVAMALDPSADPARIASLDVTVGSTDGGTDYRSASFVVDDASGSGHARFPTTFAVASNGDPGAAVGFVVRLADATRAIDADRYDVVDVPADRVVELRLLFGTSCPARGPIPAGVVSCPLEGCAWKGDHWLCDGGSLPSPDPGAAWPLEDAGDATVSRDAADSGPPDVAVADVMADAPVDGPADASIDAPADGPLEIPCDAACTADTHCVQGQCAPLPSSCLGGGGGAGPNCGTSGSDDCCASDEVAGGTFYRDYDGREGSESAQASVSQFRLDRYEVTVGRFRKFVAAAAGTPPWVPDAGDGRHVHLRGGAGLLNADAPQTPESGWLAAWNGFLPSTKADWDALLLRAGCAGDGGLVGGDWTPEADGGDEDNENRPLVCVDWYSAYAFCIWDGAFLPSDAEWNYAASGGAEQRAYPWGNNGPGTSAVFAVYGYYYPPLPGSSYQEVGLGNIAPVGSAPLGAGLWGQLDLTGNANEFVLDYHETSLPASCADCAATIDGTDRLARGGGWDSEISQLEIPTSGFYQTPLTAGSDRGFRCARTPNP